MDGYRCEDCGTGKLVDMEPDMLIAPLHVCDNCGAEWAYTFPDTMVYPFSRVVDEEALR